MEIESPIIVDKPPEYRANRNEKGFPFDEEEGRAGAWSELAARHPDLASRLRAAAWPRKRRNGEGEHEGSASADDFGNLDEHFNRFPFDDIPPEFRGHFQPHFSRRYGSQEAPQGQPQQQPAHQTIATQTEDPDQGPSSSTAIPLPQGPTPIPLPQGTTPIPLPQGTETIPLPQGTQIPQYGLRNTVDLGQKTPVEEDRSQRSMSAPPDPRTGQIPQAQGTQTTPTMSNHEQTNEGSSSNVRHIPIFVEGRDQPIINKNVDQNAQHAESKPHSHSQPHPQPQPHPQTDREQYFTDREVPVYHHPPNFSRAFGSPFGQGFRQGPQPYTQQKAYPQNTGFQRSGSPSQGRSQSPRPQSAQHNREYVEVPVYHEPPKTAKPQPKTQQQHPQYQQQQQQYQQRQQPPYQQQQQPPYQQQQQQYQQQQQQKFQQEQQQQQQPTEQPKPQQAPSSNDPISKILSIQKDVLDLMTEVETFSGKKSDKKYIYLDEMLTRNLIKLDDIETEGKENIRQARREAIKCIEKCIAVLETKADQTPSTGGSTQPMAIDEQSSNSQPNGEQEIEMNIETKDSQTQSEQDQKQGEREDETANGTPMETDPKPEEPKQGTDKPKKKVAKGTKKRDKSKENVQNQEGKASEKTDSSTASKNEKMDVEPNSGASGVDVAANQ